MLEENNLAFWLNLLHVSVLISIINIPFKDTLYSVSPGLHVPFLSYIRFWNFSSECSDVFSAIRTQAVIIFWKVYTG